MGKGVVQMQTEGRDKGLRRRPQDDTVFNYSSKLLQTLYE